MDKHGDLPLFSVCLPGRVSNQRVSFGQIIRKPFLNRRIGELRCVWTSFSSVASLASSVQADATPTFDLIYKL